MAAKQSSLVDRRMWVCFKMLFPVVHKNKPGFYQNESEIWLVFLLICVAGGGRQLADLACDATALEHSLELFPSERSEGLGEKKEKWIWKMLHLDCQHAMLQVLQNHYASSVKQVQY